MIVHREDKLRIALEGDLCVLRWADSPTAPQFDAMKEAEDWIAPHLERSSLARSIEREYATLV